MLNVSQLKQHQTASNTALGAMQAKVNSLTGAIDRLNADGTRSQGWREDEIKKLRAASTPAIGDLLKTVQQLAAVAVIGNEFWESRAYVLSQQKFDADPVADATIRAAKLEEFKLMPSPLLQMVMQDSKESRDYPTAYCAWLVGTGATSNAGLEGAANFAIGDVEIPDRIAALAAIEVCKTNKATGEHLWTVALGSRMQPVDRMNLGRMQQNASRMVQAAA